MIWVGSQVLAFYCIFHPKEKKMLFTRTAKNDGFHRGNRTGSATLYNNFQNCFLFPSWKTPTWTTGRRSTSVECAGQVGALYSSVCENAMNGEAPGLVMILSQEIRIFDNRKVLQIVSPFCISSRNAIFVLVKNRIAISVSPTTVLRRRGWSSMCAEDWTPPTGSLPTSSPSPLLYLLLPFFPFLSFYFANAQCMYVRMHACMHEVLFFRFCEWFVWNPKKRKNQILAALCCSCCKPEIIVQSTDLSHLEGKAHVFLPELWPGCIF